MPKGQKPTAGDMEKILETLAKMELKLNKLDEIQKSQEELKLEMSGMKKDLTAVQQKADDNKRRMDGLEGDVKAIQRRDDIRGNSILTTQLDRLSFFLRFQNIEEVDQENLRELMVKLLSDYTERNIDFMRWDVDLVYRVNSQYAILHGAPREVHVKFVRRETREEILRKQRQGALSYRGKEITILKQIPRQVRELRRKYYFLSNKLYLKGIGFRWLMPEGLMIFREGTRKKISNVAEAKAYLEQHKALLDAENVETEEGEVLEVQGVGLEAAGAVGGEVGPEPRILRPRQK